MKRTLPIALALSSALALAACGGGNDDAEVVTDNSVEIVADEAMEDIDAEPVVDETVVPLPSTNGAAATPEPEGPNEDEVARIESAGERAAAAAADVAAIAAGAAAATEEAADDSADAMNDAGEAAAGEMTE